AILCGQVSVGYNSFIGAGSTVRQGVKIGNNVLVGANSLVLRDVKDGEKVVGIVK
ncbi:MAG: acetyltransferase, partial [Dorea sp.]|nr:acetyltransferase [Dorea sp.]